MLQFHNSWLTPAGDGHLAAVGDLSNLKMLKLPDTELVTQELVDQVAQLSYLQDLDLTSDRVRCPAFSSLSADTSYL